MLGAVGSSPEDVSSTVSAERLALPVAARSAPPVVAEFWQPWPIEPLLLHGQEGPVPSPKQKAMPGGSTPRSRTNTSSTPLVSPGTRLLASLEKATWRPSAEIDGT